MSTNGALEKLEEKVDDGFDKFRESLHGDGGIRQRLDRMEIKVDAHEKADEGRHDEVMGKLGALSAKFDAQDSRLWKVVIVILGIALSAAGVGNAIPQLAGLNPDTQEVPALEP